MEKSSTQPQPIPPSERVIKLPADHYRHPGAPTEWWWHTGTLMAGDRVFGFEINAASFWPIGFMEVMLSDVQNLKHYEQTAVQWFVWNWAESDPSKDWWVKLQQTGGSSVVTMNAPQADPTKNMVINASITDATTQMPIKFALTMSQEGPPLIVWGTGVLPYPPLPGGVEKNNYYYSLTRLNAAGTITIGDEVHNVTGMTWMDHEYGYFGSSKDPVLWFLQDMQLDNGVHISNYQSFAEGNAPKLGERAICNATIQFPDDTTYYENQTCFMTPQEPVWTSDTGATFFLNFLVEIPAFDAALTIASDMARQDFPMGQSDLYEGAAKVQGTFQGKQVKGTAWNEQKS